MSYDGFPNYPGWTVVRKIGEGSFGTVYEIERPIGGRMEKAALKKISIPQSASETDEMKSSSYSDAAITAHYRECLDDIVSEYDLLRSLRDNPNVVKCDDIQPFPKAGTIGWDVYIRMELLTPLMERLGTMTPDRVIRLGRDISRLLVACKEKSIVHRDIKPQNIFLSNEGVFKLGDFGIARTLEHTSGATKIGTYNYMAPEVYNNKPYGHSADVYSLGMTMYWLLNNNRIPFIPQSAAIPKRSEIDDALWRRFHGEPLPPPLNGSEALKNIVLKACKFDPAERYQNAQELLEDLDRLSGAGRQSTAANRASGNASSGASSISFTGNDISKSVTISFEQARTGCSIKPKGSSEEQTLKIPAGMQDGQTVRYRGRGKPGKNGGQNGDLIITVHVLPPDEAALREKESKVAAERHKWHIALIAEAVVGLIAGISLPVPIEDSYLYLMISVAVWCSMIVPFFSPKYKQYKKEKDTKKKVSTFINIAFSNFFIYILYIYFSYLLYQIIFS